MSQARDKFIETTRCKGIYKCHGAQVCAGTTVHQPKSNNLRRKVSITVFATISSALLSNSPDYQRLTITSPENNWHQRSMFYNFFI